MTVVFAKKIPVLTKLYAKPVNSTRYIYGIASEAVYRISGLYAWAIINYNRFNTIWSLWNAYSLLLFFPYSFLY